MLTKPVCFFSFGYNCGPKTVESYVSSQTCCKNANRNLKSSVFFEHVYQIVRNSLYKRSTGEPNTHSVLRFKRKFGCFLCTCTKETLVCKSHMMLEVEKALVLVAKGVTTKNKLYVSSQTCCKKPFLYVSSRTCCNFNKQICFCTFRRRRVAKMKIAICKTAFFVNTCIK